MADGPLLSQVTAQGSPAVGSSIPTQSVGIETLVVPSRAARAAFFGGLGVAGPDDEAGGHVEITLPRTEVGLMGPVDDGRGSWVPDPAPDPS